MVEMIWREPPPAVSSKYAPVLAELQKHPGRWALVTEKATSSAAYQPWKKLGCETRVNRVNPGETPARYDIYARWPAPKGAAGHPDNRGQSAPAVVGSKGGTYDPAQRDARGVPSNGLPVESLRR